MSKANSGITAMLIAMGLTLLSGSAAVADDTELFVAGEDSVNDESIARPNVLFVIDTSGSMDSEVLTQVAYDEDIEFDDCYRSNAIYWSYTDTPPSCNSDRYFNKSVNNCQSSYANLNSLGVYQGELLEWRVRTGRNQDDIWVEFPTSSISHTRTVECKADRGVSGAALNDGRYAANGDNYGPYQNNSTREPAWVRTYYLFNGNYLNWQRLGGTISTTRIEIVKDVTKNLINNLSDVNIGLMRFNNSQGGPVIYAMEDIETAREDFNDAIDDLDADGYTPLSETLYEAALYFRGGSVDYGNGYEHRSVNASRVSNGNTYNTPIDVACQRNFIIYLTDGEPTQDTGSENKTETMIGRQCATLPGDDSNGKCLDELAGFLHDEDQSTEFYGDQNITTYTIGFTIDLPLLAETAKAGGGEYFLADSTATLTTALTKIAISILDLSTTFTAPSVPVNAFNRTQNLSDVFVSVFQPSTTVRWPGNLKKYRLSGGVLRDQNALPAVDPANGFFYTNAQSYWSDEIDGSQPSRGGAASNLPAYTDRKLYSNLTNGDLTADANRIKRDNGITAALLGTPATYDAGLGLYEVDKVINWMNGYDYNDDNDNGSSTDTRLQMGDPLHVRPAPVIYGGTNDSPDMVVYTSTNDGYLHAIDADDGSELWSFVPRRLLPLTYAQYLDNTSVQRVYGLDGEIQVHVVNDDKVAGISGSERVILLFGMRRGGKAVFAVDVTNRNDPQLLWEIDDTTTGFTDLGLTFSTPQISKLNIGGTTYDAAFFGGGYDSGQDSDNYRTDSVGKAIYAVDVLTGTKLWSAGQSASHNLQLTDMSHSIPAPLQLVDMNNDKYADRIYVGDMGGRIWRFDIRNGQSVAQLGEGGMLASLGAADLATPTDADVRRFYNQIDVAEVIQPGGRFLALNVGSGYRAHPLDRAIDDEFYSIRDFNVFNVLPTNDYPEPVTRDDLVDITPDVDTLLDYDAAGWRLSMLNNPGEKVLGRALTFDGIVFFNSFSPGVGANACTAVAGQNRAYRVSLLSGAPIFNLDESTDEDVLETTDRSTSLEQGGIAPEPIFLFPEENPDEPIVCSGLECDSAGVLSRPTRTYWTQDGAQ